MASDIIQNVVDSFKFNKPKNPKLVRTVWRIKVDGKLVTLNSGKSVWKRIGDAKNALRNHCEGIINYSLDPYAALVSSGRVEFVAVELE